MQVEKFVDLVEYQSGAIVSKEVMKKDSGTVTLFAFDKGQGLSEHTAPFDALVYVLDGSATVLIAGQPYAVKKGEMVIMPANKPHSINADEKFKMLLVLLKK